MIKILLAVALTFSQFALANNLEFTVHHGPGGPSDKITRLLSSKMPNKYTVVNRPGAQGKIAVRQILSSNNSLMIATVPQIFVTNFLSSVDAGYQEDDLEILYVIGIMPNVLVCNNKLGFKTYNDFLSSTKSLNFGVAGLGSSEHIATEFLLKQFDNNHVVIPYAQGGASSLNDLLGGNIDCMFANYPLVKEHITDNKKITAFISSHNLNLPIKHWRQEYKDAFPFQGSLAVVVSKKMSQELKNEIVADIDRINDRILSEEIRNVGIFPIMSKNQTSIRDIYRNNIQTKDLIIKYNLKLQ